MDPSSRQAAWAAAGTAALAIAFQTAGKATRDALFLSEFPVTSLPAMMVAAAGASVLLALGGAWALTRVGPRRLVPLAFVASAALLLLEWMVVGRAGRLAAVLVYLHYAAFGAVLVSGVWSVVSERFDPRTARRQIGRIGGAGTIGGVAGGLVAAQAGTWLTVPVMLPILAALHLAAGATITVTARGIGGGPRPEDDEPAPTEVARRLPYLRVLLLLVLLTTLAEVVLDYVFKARVTDWLGRGEDLLRFFAWFYTATGVLAFALQTGVARRALRRLGLARSVGALPAAAAIGSGGAVVLGGLPALIAARGAEAVVRTSLYRAGYELLFAPLLPAEKRASKTLLDVGVTRLGDVLGAVVVRGMLLVPAALELLLLLGAVLSLLAVGLVFRLQRGYERALQHTLQRRARGVDTPALEDAALQTAILHTAGGLAITIAEEDRAESAEREPPSPAPDTSRGDRDTELTSRDVTRVLAALRAGPLPAGLVDRVIPLLAWDAVAAAATEALRTAPPEAAGRLVAALLDPDEEFTVRRRLPLVLAGLRGRAVAEGLVAGLNDTRFEVRYRCGLALHRVVGADETVTLNRSRIEAAVLREVRVDRRVWESHRVLEQREDESWSPLFDEVLKNRASRALQHVFTVLALILEREPLQLAYRGLFASDPHVRGTALEYLEATLPTEIRRALWPFLEDTSRRQPARRSRDEIVDDLRRSAATIALDLERHRRPSSG